MEPTCLICSRHALTLRVLLKEHAQLLAALDDAIAAQVASDLEDPTAYRVDLEERTLEAAHRVEQQAQALKAVRQARTAHIASEQHVRDGGELERTPYRVAQGT